MKGKQGLKINNQIFSVEILTSLKIKAVLISPTFIFIIHGVLFLEFIQLIEAYPYDKPLKHSSGPHADAKLMERSNLKCF